MTLSQFLRALKKTHYEWRLMEISCYPGILRGFIKNKPVCPVTGVFYSQNKSFIRPTVANVWKAAELMGLDPMLSNQIMHATDNNPGHDPELRRQLLQACGVIAYHEHEEQP